MSAQIGVFGIVKDIETLKEISRASKEKLGWLDGVQFSLSGSGELCAFMYDNHVTTARVMKSANSSKLEYTAVFEGILADMTIESATYIIALSVSLQQKSVGTTTLIKTSTWDCFAVGFSSGYLRIYTDTGMLLFEQLFNPSPIRTIKYCHPMVLQDELLILYDDMVIAVDGFSLYQCLRFCRTQQMKPTSNAQKNISISFKKWHFQDQISTVDVEFFGIKNTTPFEHLFQASLAGGCSNYIGQAGLGPVYNYVAVGKSPFIAQYCPSEQASQPIMSEVVMNVASKLISYIPGSSWLSGWKAPKDEKLNFDPPIPISKNICIDDPMREILSIKASPKGNLGILSDKFGRLLLLDVSSMIIVNIWKGYRDAQCGWIDASALSDDDISTRQQSTLFLIIYIRKRGILEIWCPYQHFRVSAFNVGKGGKLISNSFGALGEGSLSSPLNIPDWRPNRSCCFLLKEDGTILNISVPFENCLGLEYMLSLEDSKYINNIMSTLESREILMREQEEIKSDITKIKLSLNIKKVLDVILSDEKLPDEFKCNVCFALMKNMSLKDESRIKEESSAIYNLCKMYTNLSALYTKISSEWKMIKFRDPSPTSCLLTDLQYTIEKYFSKNSQSFSLELPDKNDLCSCFELNNGVDNFALSFVPGANSIQVSRFLTLLLLYSENWLNITSLIMESGVPVSVTFNIFLECCLSLDKQILMQGFQTQISTVVSHFLSLYSSSGELWEDFFSKIRLHNSVGHGLILLIYCQNIAIDALEIDSCTVEASPIQKSLSEEGNNMIFEDDVGWVSLSPEHEKWYTVRQQLTDMLHLQINTGVECNIETLLNSSDHTVTHIVARCIIENNLIQNVIDWIERCHERTSEEDDSTNIEDCNDDNLQWLLNLVPLWPYQLNHVTISVCLVECMIYLWSEVLASQSPEVELQCLISAAKIVLSVQSVEVQQNLLHVLWETVFCNKLKRIYHIIEKVGRQPKDRVCIKEFSLSLECAIRFVSIARQIMIDVNIASPSTDERTVLQNENVWVSDQRNWLIHKVVCSDKPLNPNLVLLHAQLLTSMELILSLNIKNIRPSALFLPKFHDLFFTSMTTPGHLTSSSSPEIDICREQMLKNSTKAAISTDINIQPHATSWINLIVNLANIWDLIVPIQSYMTVLLYSVGRFSEADEVVMTSSQRQDLGLQLLGVLLSQLELQIYRDEETQKLYLPILTPHISSWLRTKHNPDVAIVDIRTVFKAYSQVLTWVSGDSVEISYAKQLQSCLANKF